jgi:hypothetical protein
MVLLLRAVYSTDEAGGCAAVVDRLAFLVVFAAR